ncbi:hypothetical protein LEP1GSC043_0228 [Leptospira weilii str. Ecochallenge]|uniref:Uncharacterized protein n=1 Tax=Leptospira weilii str. Ecochallenge TaxID=1049986 RepID=N1U1L9_9LEPT|nr:hypothetical protein LEP1GSC043_0228 [Leptospira weilii str. Ecochallenge]
MRTLFGLCGTRSEERTFFLEDNLKSIQDPFLQKGIQLIVGAK